MKTHVGYFAGAEREFCLKTGQILDLEEACDKTGIGAIYFRVGSGQYFFREVTNVIIQGLVGSGMSFKDAKKLVHERVDFGEPLAELQGLALDILLTRFAGEEKSDGGETSGDPEEPIDVGQLFDAFVKVGITPDQVRAMDYSDLLKILKSAGSNGTRAPTDEEFEAMVQDWEARQNDD